MVILFCLLVMESGKNILSLDAITLSVLSDSEAHSFNVHDMLDTTYILHHINTV